MTATLRVHSSNNNKKSSWSARSLARPPYKISWTCYLWSSVGVLSCLIHCKTPAPSPESKKLHKRAPLGFTFCLQKTQKSVRPRSELGTSIFLCIKVRLLKLWEGGNIVRHLWNLFAFWFWEWTLLEKSKDRPANIDYVKFYRIFVKRLKWFPNVRPANIDYVINPKVSFIEFLLTLLGLNSKGFWDWMSRIWASVGNLEELGSS